MDDKDILNYYVAMTTGVAFYCNNIEWNDDNDRVLYRAFYSGNQNNETSRPIPEVVVDNGLAYYYKVEKPFYSEYHESLGRMVDEIEREECR